MQMLQRSGVERAHLASWNQQSLVILLALILLCTVGQAVLRWQSDACIQQGSAPETRVYDYIHGFSYRYVHIPLCV